MFAWQDLGIEQMNKWVCAWGEGKAMQEGLCAWTCAAKRKSKQDLVCWAFFTWEKEERQ